MMTSEVSVCVHSNACELIETTEAMFKHDFSIFRSDNLNLGMICMRHLIDTSNEEIICATQQRERILSEPCVKLTAVK